VAEAEVDHPPAAGWPAVRQHTLAVVPGRREQDHRLWRWLDHRHPVSQRELGVQAIGDRAPRPGSDRELRLGCLVAGGPTPGLQRLVESQQGAASVQVAGQAGVGGLVEGMVGGGQQHVVALQRGQLPGRDDRQLEAAALDRTSALLDRGPHRVPLGVVEVRQRKRNRAA